MLILAMSFMAAHRRGRRNGPTNPKFQVLKVDQIISFGALAAQGALQGALTALGVTKFRVTAVDLFWSADGFTTGEGPILVGISNGNLSTTEVLECLDAVPTGPSDVIARERLRRPVRQSGIFAGFNTHEVLNDGKYIRTKLNTLLDEGDELNAWAQNQSGATLTAGTVIRIMGRVYGYWA